MPFSNPCADEARELQKSREQIPGFNMSDADAQKFIDRDEAACNERLAQETAAALEQKNREIAWRQEANEIRWRQRKEAIVIGAGVALAVAAAGGFMWLHRRKIANAALDTAAAGVRVSRSVASKRDEIATEIKRRADR